MVVDILYTWSVGAAVIVHNITWLKQVLDQSTACLNPLLLSFSSPSSNEDWLAKWFFCQWYSQLSIPQLIAPSRYPRHTAVSPTSSSSPLFSFALNAWDCDPISATVQVSTGTHKQYQAFMCYLREEEKTKWEIVLRVPGPPLDWK